MGRVWRRGGGGRGGGWGVRKGVASEQYELFMIAPFRHF